MHRKHNMQEQKQGITPAPRMYALQVKYGRGS